MIAKYIIKNLKELKDSIGATEKNFLITVSKTAKKILLEDIVVDAQENVVGKVLKARSGSLARAIYGKVTVKDKSVILELGADLKKAPYARIHEYGGVIVPKKAKALTIPLNGTMGFAREHSGLFIWKSPKSGKLFLAKSDGGNLKLMYLLAKKVTMPERPYLRPAMEKNKNKLINAIKGLKEKDFKS